MGRARCVGLVLLLAAGVAPIDLRAQEAGPPSTTRERGFRLQQNHPNPFNPVTRIPFTLGEEVFVDGRAVVSVRIFNVLQQLVAVPKALDHPRGDGVLVDRLEYTEPGDYSVFWDGMDRNGRKVASGMYIAQLEVNGQRATIKMQVTK
jgi:hypothetical protein